MRHSVTRGVGWIYGARERVVEALPQIKHSLGRARLQNTLRPRRDCDARPGTYSARFGFGSFPLHTDHARRPPRYVVLECSAGSGGTLTLLQCWGSLLSDMPADLVRRLGSAVFQIGRGSAAELGTILFRGTVQAECYGRYDMLAMDPQNSDGRLVAEWMNAYVVSGRHDAAIDLKQGELLVFDNWRLLHGRSAVVSASERGTIPRILERYYLGGTDVLEL